jgi:hypothetical protein
MQLRSIHRTFPIWTPVNTTGTLFTIVETHWRVQNFIRDEFIMILMMNLSELTRNGLINQTEGRGIGVTAPVEMQRKGSSACGGIPTLSRRGTFVEANGRSPLPRRKLNRQHNSKPSPYSRRRPGRNITRTAAGISARARSQSRLSGRRVAG